MPQEASRLRLGIGDDAALVEVVPGRQLILTTDLSIEGVHFLRRLHPPRAVGHRALARALSDIAAMGGTPRFVLISLAVSRGTPRAWIGEFYAGLLALARRLRVALIGGDTAVVSEKMTVDVVVAGEVPRGRALRREGARPGDQLFVSGTLGMSALGLRLLRSRRSRRAPGAGRAIEAHLYPEPQCGLGRFLSEHCLASAAIDVSDGLSTDLAHLCEASQVGARLWAKRIPVPRTAAAQPPEIALDLALHGGEDYQLLFTIPARKVRHLPRRFRGTTLHWIGEIRRSKRLLITPLEGKPVLLRPGGHDHFRAA